jgi:hypothetical protein
MFRILLFFTAQVLVSGFAIWRGGKPERVVGSSLLAAMVASALVPVAPRESYYSLHLPLFAIDLLLLSTLILVAARANRFWPIWLAALQLVAIGVHGVRAYDPHILPIVYARIVGEIAYPMLALLVIGTVRHHSRALRLGGERDWSPLKW